MTLSTRPQVPFTKDELVQRLFALRGTVLPARAAAFAKMPEGLKTLVFDLELYDCGIFGAKRTLASMRSTLDLPVIEGLREFGELEAALYQGRFLDTASALTAGD